MKGWHRESYRHTLAAKGISLGRTREISLHAEALPKSHTYPISPGDVHTYLARVSSSELKGLKRVEFVMPKDSQEKEAWARYMSGKKEIRIFAQPVKDGKISGEDPKELHAHMNEYVLPHEMGHHIALRDLPVDKDLAMAEARADAHVVGMSVKDKDAKIFKSLHENNREVAKQYKVIRKLPGKNKFRLYSKETHRNLGTYPSKELAIKREKQINFFKNRSKIFKKRHV
jgi:hypothetical protein